jgi:hypothetical protein
MNSSELLSTVTERRIMFVKSVQIIHYTLLKCKPTSSSQKENHGQVVETLSERSALGTLSQAPPRYLRISICKRVGLPDLET